MGKFTFDENAREALDYAIDMCRENGYEFITPEMLLLGILGQWQFSDALVEGCADEELLRRVLSDYIERYISKIDASEKREEVAFSWQMNQVLMGLSVHIKNSSAEAVTVPALVKMIMDLSDCYAGEALKECIDVSPAQFLVSLIRVYAVDDDEDDDDEFDPDDLLPDDEFGDMGLPFPDVEKAHRDEWLKYAIPVDTLLEGRNPLVGREEELERTIRVLCRKDKNNPLHVGQPGVGKTALVYGLARMIAEGRVPGRLRGSKIYRLDVGDLLAGTQYRGDMEKRLKMILEGAAARPGSIIYIDEIHTLVGAGAIGEGAMDASNMLKPYLEDGQIRFIGSTTYEEYSRHFERRQSLVRRFQQIDVPEPSVDEAVRILRQLQRGYEKFHHVKYDDDALEYAVTASARHLSGRYLPDKAIDIIDEAGAYRETHPEGEGPQRVGKELVADILARMCKVENLAVREESAGTFRDLSDRISVKVFGQDAAVRAVTESVLMGKAGLTDDTKPLASLLFVGPTGVGKTEVARVLAEEMGVELVRFDMSEYVEKHAVAKLIGAPAGYVGYDDGGLLTDAVRRSPGCVLLLDEIEKAHSDIYNILLQVMDYARLTDNKGRQADFHNVVLIMTSNAGAQFASRAKVGFGSNVTAGDAMLREVKRMFKPEFINRLSGTVVFNEMTREMASLILEKKLGALRRLLTGRGVELTLTDAAREHLLRAGFTREYGAREMDRVIASRLKPLLMRELLFGRLADGGTACVDVENEGLKLI